MKIEENESALKHQFGKSLLKRISDSFREIHPSFDHPRFHRLISTLESLEMKPRVHQIRDELQRQLPSDYKKALLLLQKAARGGKLKGFDLWPFTEFVQTYGLDHPEASLNALSEFTKLFTAEWAIRPFIKRDPQATLRFLVKCAQSENEHLRRWASEGTRPRLPWGERLHDFVQDPQPTLPILELLKFDPELYVRKSVANHLNDISKDHPLYLIVLLKRWKKEAGTEHLSKINWIIRRSLRTLIKEGHPGALQLIGVSTKTEIKITPLTLKSKILRLGDKLDFQFELQSLSSKPQKLVVDYLLHFVKSNGRTAPKVFKLKTMTLPAKEKLAIGKSYHLKKITTRDYYPGLHSLEIQVNGVIVAKQEWRLKI
ncbi:MAG: DNA alkylation repair protein [Verrucomicrobiota bacterium]